MTTNGIADTSKALATVEKETGARALVTQYSGDFAAVLPTHIRPEQWVRLAKGALKKGKKVQVRVDGQARLMTELEQAAIANPAVFLAALMDAARLGLEPGTEQYYLTPRKVKGQPEILGIVGYQGMIELMYRAGGVASVVAECVYEQDRFDFQPGRDDVPQHEINWDSDNRGGLRLVYAFARMTNGATSKVVVLNRQAIARVQAKSQGAHSEYSPWQTDPDAMWLKSAIRQLAKWVPTSAEYRRVVNELGAVPVGGGGSFAPPIDITDHTTTVDDVLDGEVVDENDRTDEQAAMEAEAAR